MKKYIVLILIPVFFACGRAAKEKAMELQASNDSLMEQATQKDVAINDFMSSVDNIQSILDSIKTKENIISHNTQQMGELKLSSRDKIKHDIKIIYAMMLKDKEQMNVLSRKLHSSGLKLKEFQKLVDHLQQDITAKNSEIETLRGNLQKMDVAIASANDQIGNLNNIVQDQSQKINSQTQTIVQQTTALNTAYYIVGTNKELRDKGIIKGGKIVPDFNKTGFKKVDITKTTEIPLKDSKVKVLSNHPSASFKLNQDRDKTKSLQVTDYAAFWSNTKYLVLETNKPLGN